MNFYEYEAMTASGRLVKGQIEAQSNEDAAQALKAMGLTVQSIQAAPAQLLSTPISRSEFLLFNQQLASIAQSGLPLEKSLRALAREASTGRIRKMMDALADDLEAGLDIEQALAKYKSKFPPLYGRIVAAGVKSGRLGEMLVSLNRHLEVASQTRRIVIEALAYPIVVISLASIILTIFGLLVIPPMKLVFADMGTRVPAITRMLFDFGDSIPLIWAVVGSSILLFFIVRWLLGMFAVGLRFREQIFMKIPFLGAIFRDCSLGRMADTMAVLVNSGCDLPTALRMGADASGSHVLGGQGELLASHIEEGRPLAMDEIFAETLPGLFIYSIDLGGRRNQLADNMYNLAEMYFTQVKTRQARFQALLLPFLIVVVGLFVGFGIVALFMPMVALLQTAGG
ncbi:MAG: type II secretion system F family protein [Planctomycetes bacterium]|nr:type II secretion system F family protein [Planctomycetota bacterium]